MEFNKAQGGAGYEAGFAYGGGLYVPGGSDANTVTLCGDTVESNTAQDGAGIITGPTSYGGGLYIATGATVYIDALTQVINNTADADPNVDGSYIIQNC
jgi:hypothetical protein